MQQQVEDKHFMQEALKEAQKAYEMDEVPVGAVLVYRNEIASRAYNQVESLNDASAHAEVLCLREGSFKLKNWRLTDTVLYTTLEPCIMCMGALILARVKRVVFAAFDLRQGACGSLVDLERLSHPIHQLKVQRGILQEEAAALMTNFFRQKRRENDDRKTSGRAHFRTKSESACLCQADYSLSDSRRYPSAQ
jgi:tRNA(adenine34) deaminase